MGRRKAKNTETLEETSEERARKEAEKLRNYEMEREKYRRMFKDLKDNKQFSEYFIRELLKCCGASKYKPLDILRVIHICNDLFLKQGRMIEIDPPVRVVADIHGQYSDLIRMFSMCGFPPSSNYIFLGDYVDRGTWCIETILLLLAFKARYPNNFFLLRGNHEAGYMNNNEGFHQEIYERRQQNGDFEIYSFSKLFDVMPICGLIGGRILCMHGGISPHLKSIDDLRKLKVPFNDYEKDCLETDLMWADPSPRAGWTPNPRGASYCFGEDVLKQLCDKLNIDLVIRGHQVQQNGYEFFADKRLVTIFSAPHYTGTFSNYAAVAKIGKGLRVSFEVLKPYTIPVEYVNDKADTLMCEPFSRGPK